MLGFLLWKTLQMCEHLNKRSLICRFKVKISKKLKMCQNVVSFHGDLIY